MSLDLHLRGVYQFSRYFSQFYCNSRFHNICIDFRCRSLLMQLPLIEEMCSNLCPSRSIIQKMMVKNLIEFVNKFYKFPHTHTQMYVQKTHCVLDLHSYIAAYCTLSLRVALVVVYAVCIIVCIPNPSSQNDMHLFHSCVTYIHSLGSKARVTTSF